MTYSDVVVRCPFQIYKDQRERERERERERKQRERDREREREKTERERQREREGVGGWGLIYFTSQGSGCRVPGSKVFCVSW